MRTVLPAVLLALSACGKPAPPPVHGETPEYQDWRGKQVFRQVPAPNGERGRIVIQMPTTRSSNPADFCELFVNGRAAGRWKLSEGAVQSADVSFTNGPVNSFDLWDSTTNRHYRAQVNPKDAVDFDCVPDENGYDLKARPRSP